MTPSWHDRKICSAMTSEDFYENHAKLLVEQFVWLRSRDKEYAQAELKAYVRHKDCPCPELEMRVRREWMAYQRKLKLENVCSW
jgi:hypothetical protein